MLQNIIRALGRGNRTDKLSRKSVISNLHSLTCSWYGLCYNERDFSASTSPQEQLHRKTTNNYETVTTPSPGKRKAARIQGSKTSLRRVAVEAERFMDRSQQDQHSRALGDQDPGTKIVTAYCAAERYDVASVARILTGVGFSVDPFHTGLLPRVVHVQYPSSSSRSIAEKGASVLGDVFIFPSGTVVAWDVPEDTISTLVSKELLLAAENAHIDRIETEDLEFIEDPSRDKSSIVGELIRLGTRKQSASSSDENPASTTAQTPTEEPQSGGTQSETNLVLAKIAFSSGLARSSKLAVLEAALESYFESTRSIPSLLSQGSKLPFTRKFILRKMGELMLVRAQLNLYSELTDSLPDLFWDSRHELGLEGYFERVGRALDVNVRIKTLNQKMDYAQEIATVLRERLSEKHGLLLEWLIIWLIAIEVAFGVWHLREESIERSDPNSMRSLTRRYYERVLNEESSSNVPNR